MLRTSLKLALFAGQVFANASTIWCRRSWCFVHYQYFAFLACHEPISSFIFLSSILFLLLRFTKFSLLYTCCFVFGIILNSHVEFHPLCRHLKHDIWANSRPFRLLSGSNFFRTIFGLGLWLVFVSSKLVMSPWNFY